MPSGGGWSPIEHYTKKLTECRFLNKNKRRIRIGYCFKTVYSIVFKNTFFFKNIKEMYSITFQWLPL